MSSTGMAENLCVKLPQRSWSLELRPWEDFNAKPSGEVWMSSCSIVNSDMGEGVYVLTASQLWTLNASIIVH